MLTADDTRDLVATPEADVSGQDDATDEDRKRAVDSTVSNDAEVKRLTDKWKRSLADAENARKRADASRAEGRDHDIAVAVEALAPAFDALCLGIEAARASPDADDPRIASHMEGLRNIRAVFETGLKALGVKVIAPMDAPFDPMLHEAMQMLETTDTEPGHVLVLHRPGFAVGNRLIRPAHVTVSAAPTSVSGEE